MNWIIDKILDWWNYGNWVLEQCIIAAILIIALFFIIDAQGSYITMRSATVIDEKFSPDNQQTGSGIIVNSKGGVSPIITHSGHADEWFVIVKYSDSEFDKIRVSVSEYYTVKPGDEIVVKLNLGKYTGIRYNEYITKYK